MTKVRAIACPASATRPITWGVPAATRFPARQPLATGDGAGVGIGVGRGVDVGVGVGVGVAVGTGVAVGAGPPAIGAVGEPPTARTLASGDAPAEPNMPFARPAIPRIPTSAKAARPAAGTSGRRDGRRVTGPIVARARETPRSGGRTGRSGKG